MASMACRNIDAAEGALSQAHPARSGRGSRTGKNIPGTCRSFAAMSSSSNSPRRSPSSSARTAPANRRCWRRSARWPAMTKRAAARATCRSTIRRAIDKSGATGRPARPLAAEGHRRLVLSRESFYAVARYLDQAALEPVGRAAGFLSWSHGEGFIRFFEERCRRQGIYICSTRPRASPFSRRPSRRSGCELSSRQITWRTHGPVRISARRRLAPRCVTWPWRRPRRAACFASRPVRARPNRFRATTDHFA